MKREYAVDPLPEEKQQTRGRKVKLFADRPETPVDALLRCAPGQEPDPSVQELIHLRDIIQDAIDELSPRERWVFDAVTTGGASLRSLGIPKTTVARIRDKAIDKLRVRLSESEAIRKFLGVDSDGN